MHLFFGSLSFKSSTIKRVWLRAIMWCMTFWEVSWKTCEWGQNTLGNLMLICGDNHWSWKLSKQIVEVSEGATYEEFWLVEDSNQKEHWVKCHRVKCCSVWVVKTSTSKDVTNIWGINLHDLLNVYSSQIRHFFVHFLTISTSRKQHNKKIQNKKGYQCRV